MVKESPRLLDVDARTYIPFLLDNQTLVTSIDVIHCWALPRLGVKADAVPGRLNSLRFLINKPGVYFGECSEICGTNHSFIPIVVEAI